MSVWTEKQAEAITSRGCSLIVSAAAGSGKTSVLVERLLRILSDTENKTPADRIAVVTFTNDAAAQMRQRLSDAFWRALEIEDDSAVCGWLCKQQALLGAAKISTIHAFCFDLLRENTESLHVSNGFRILDEAENNAVISEAADNVFERLYAENPSLMTRLCDFFGSGRGDETLKSVVISLYEFLQSVPYYEDWLDKHASLGEAGGGILLEEYLSQRAEDFGRCFKFAEAACNLCE